MSVVRLFFGAVFISAENSDICFEVKAVFCFDFYVFRDVFRRIPNVHQDCVVSNRFGLARFILKNAVKVHHFCSAKMVNEAARLLFTRRQPFFTQKRSFSSHLHRFQEALLVKSFHYAVASLHL